MHLCECLFGSGAPEVPATEAPNARAVGAIGIVMTASIGVAAIILDIPSFMQIIHMWKSMI